MSKKVIGIWAQTKNGVIGKDQVMPWHLPAELQHFKQTRPPKSDQYHSL